jgi:hypothetical protein
MIIGFLFVCIFVEWYWLYRLLNRVDRLEKQVESMDEMKPINIEKSNLATPGMPYKEYGIYKPIKGFNPVKPKTVLPGEGGAREVQEGAQVFEFDVKKSK